MGNGAQLGAVDSAAKWTAAAFGAVTTALGAVGATGGGLERVLRNELWLSLAAFGLIFFGIVLAVIARPNIPLAGTDATSNARLLMRAFVSFAFGLALALYLGVASPSTRERPQISASLTRGDRLLLDASVRASGMSSDSSLIVIVDGLVGRDRAAIRLYKSQMGPDRQGLVSLPLKIEIPPGEFDEIAVAATFDAEQRDKCVEGNLAEGCVILRLPRVPRAPQLSLDLEGDAGSRAVVARVKSLVRAQTSVAVTITAVGQTKPLLAALLAPDDGGIVDSALEAPVPRDAREICVAASMVAARPLEAPGWRVEERILQCPPGASGVTWATLHLGRASMPSGR